MRCTHPQLYRYPDNTKQACHRRARSKMEWIYTRTKVSGHGSLELAQENRRKEIGESPLSSSQLLCSLLPNSSPSSNPSAPSRASFTESSLQGAPQMKICTSTTRYFQLLFSLIEYTSEVTRLHASHIIILLLLKLWPMHYYYFNMTMGSLWSINGGAYRSLLHTTQKAYK